MAEFILNYPETRRHSFYTLDTFARGYVEALFFTNGDTGDENEHRLNELGVERLTRASVERIRKDCAAFESQALELLKAAYDRPGYSEERAGHDFWFSRQGHGVGFWSRSELEPDSPEYERLTQVMIANRANPAVWGAACDARNRLKESSLGASLSAIAKGFGESYVEIYRGRIYVR